MPNAFDGLDAEPYVPNYLQDEIQFRIDNDLRTVAIPPDGVVLGVVGDKNVNHVNFQMPAWYNGFDMSTFQARINFIDAEGNVNYYTVTDMTVMDTEGNEVTGTPGETDIIYFTWLVDSYATNYVGNVRFNVRLFKYDTSVSPAVLSQAFNTQIGTCRVLEGIRLADEITQEQAEDLLFHMTQELQDVTDSLKLDIEAKGAEVLESIPDDYDALSDEIDGLKSDLNHIKDNERLTVKSLSSWRQGGMLNGNIDGSVRYRLVAENLIILTHDTTFYIESGRRAGFHTYSSDGQFLSDSGWQTSSYTIPANTRFRIVISATTTTDATEAAITANETFTNYVTYQSEIGKNVEGIRTDLTNNYVGAKATNIDDTNVENTDYANLNSGVYASQGIYSFHCASKKPENIPSEVKSTSFYASLTTYHTGSSNKDTYGQMLVHFVPNSNWSAYTTDVYFRIKKSGVWAQWSTLIKDTYLTENVASNIVPINITDANVETAEYSNFNNIAVNRIYNFHCSSKKPQNSPPVKTSNFYGQLLVSRTGTSTDRSTTQIFIHLMPNSNWSVLTCGMYVRYNVNGAWSLWTKVATGNDVATNTFVNISETLILDNAYSDFNNVETNSIYNYHCTTHANNCPSEIPTGRFYGTLVDTLSGDGTDSMRVQTFYSFVPNSNWSKFYTYVYHRLKTNGAWSEWTGAADINAIEKSTTYNLVNYIPNNFTINNTDTITVLGDSICEGWASDIIDGEVTGHVAEVKMVTKLSQLLGITIHNHAHGGWAFAHTTNNIITEFGQAMDAGHLNSQYLMIAAGTNDFDNQFTKSSFKTALDDLASEISSNYSGQVIIVTPINRSKDEDKSISINWYRDTLTNWAILNEYWVIDGSRLGFPTANSEYKELMMADGIHPSNYGHVFYAKALNQYIHN